MTADLVARLRECTGNEYMGETARRRLLVIADEMEAASALRSSGEAVACTVNGYLPRQRAVELRLDCDVPEWITKNPGIRAYLSAASASAWRSKVEDFLRRLATIQPPNVLLQQITMLGEARDLLREAITPPTSTKGG